MSNEVGRISDGSVVESFVNQNDILCVTNNLSESDFSQTTNAYNTELENISASCSDLVSVNNSDTSMLNAEYHFDKNFGEILTRKCINDLIGIFIEKGYSVLKDCCTLLGTKQ